MNKTLSFCFIALFIFLQSCKNKESVANDQPTPLPAVSIVHPSFGNIEENKQLNGQVVYLNKTTITAPIAGYVTVVNTAIGNWVKAGQLLFKIQTKESKALQDSNISTPNQFGIIPVYASNSGFINSLQITAPGVFITEGNTLASIVKNTDLVIQVNAPFEYSKLLNDQKNIRIELANKEIFNAVFFKALPIIDALSQTQQLLFKLTKFSPLPENLNVIVNFSSQAKKNSTLVNKAAVLTNETQDQFWIMKVINDTLAVKIPIKKGLENKDLLEILQPQLKLTDAIILKGAYGLPDSTKVKIN